MYAVLSIENVWETNFIVCRIEKYASSWTERFLFIVRCNLTGYNHAFTFITPSGLVHRLSRIPPPHCSVGSVDDVLSCWDSSHLSMTYAIDNIYIYIRDATIRVNTILHIAFKNIAIYCCIAIFGLGPLVMLKCYTCVNNSWI